MEDTLSQENRANLKGESTETDQGTLRSNAGAPLFCRRNKEERREKKRRERMEEKRRRERQRQSDKQPLGHALLKPIQKPK